MSNNIQTRQSGYARAFSEPQRSIVGQAGFPRTSSLSAHIGHSRIVGRTEHEELATLLDHCLLPCEAKKCSGAVKYAGQPRLARSRVVRKSRMICTLASLCRHDGKGDQSARASRNRSSKESRALFARHQNLMVRAGAVHSNSAQKKGVGRIFSGALLMPSRKFRAFFRRPKFLLFKQHKPLNVSHPANRPLPSSQRELSTPPSPAAQA